MELSTWDGRNLPANVARVAQSARIDAFRGLGATSQAASDDESTDRTFSSVLLHLLR